MPLLDSINSNLKDALKSGDTVRIKTLRLVLAELHNKEIEARGKKDGGLNDNDIQNVLIREAKKRKEAVDIYNNAGRKELAQSELEELKIIESYLPEKLGESEIERIIDKILEGVDPNDRKNFGKIMGDAMKAVQGRAEGGVVSQILKRKLS